MAKARARAAAARKIKDKWKAKKWYSILAPPMFDNAMIAETLADDPNKLINRVTEVTLQDITNDFRKSHVKLYFQIHGVEEKNAYTHYIGHAFTSDYLRRMIRRRRSKIDGVFDVTTKDGAVIRVKPIAVAEKRIQNSQRRMIRALMRKTIIEQGSKRTLSDFVKYILDGRITVDIYQACKHLYPLKRIEIYKTEVLSLPTTKEEEPREQPKEEKPTEEEKPEEAEKKEGSTEEIVEETEESNTAVEEESTSRETEEATSDRKEE